MNSSESEISTVILGCFLHDVGKVIQRADTVGPIPNKNHQRFGEDFIDGVLKDCDIDNPPHEWRCILKSIRHHHASDGPSNAENTYIPWFAYEADNLASAHDRKNQTKLIKDGNRIDEMDESVKEKWDSKRRLQSIFICLENANEKESYFDLWLRESLENKKTWESDKYPYPSLEKEIKKDTKEQYEKLKIGLNRLIKDISNKEVNLGLVNKCINYLEELFQFVPPDTFINHTNDISLFDHLKLTAAIGSCLFYYLDENRSDLFEDATNNFSYKDSPWNKIDKDEIRNKKAYLLLKADISGIQDFIYNISTKNALKSLRGRSFYLELLLQQTADEILRFFKLSRCNQIYLGGGGFSLLLPNTQYVIKNLEVLENAFNKFLFDKFQERLHISFAYSELSGNDIRSKTQSDNKEVITKEHPLNEAWKKISHQISDKKLRKFSHILEDIFKSIEEKDYTQRLEECKVCHKEDTNENLQSPYEDKSFKACSDCNNLIKFGEWLTKEEKNFKFEDSQDGLFPKIYIVNETIKITSQDLRLAHEAEPNCFVFHNEDWFTPPRIYWSTAYAKNENYEILDFEDLANTSEGVERIGVLRADIDNLGNVFSGLKESFGIKQELKSISRDASISRNLSKFFTHYLNEIIQDKYENAISVVYAGGDDLFLVGAWDKVIDCAFEIDKKFKDYTLGALTLSAGISIHNPKYPLYRMAKDSGRAEKVAKKNKDKDSLCVYFDDGIFRESNPSHVFTWDEWRDEIKPLYKELASFNLSTGYLYELLMYFKDVINENQSYFYRILYNTVRMEESIPELKKNIEWEPFKSKLFLALKSNLDSKYYETALNWILLGERKLSKKGDEYELYANTR